MSLLTAKLKNVKILYGLQQENDCGYTDTSSHGYSTISFLDNSELTLENKKDELLKSLRTARFEVNKNKIKKNILTSVNKYLNEYHYWETRNGWRAISNLVDKAINWEFLDKDILDLLELLLNKTFLRDNTYFDQFKAKFNEILTSLQSVPDLLFQQEDGTWGDHYYNKWQRFCYHTHPYEYDTTVSREGLLPNESLKGFEYEGSFPGPESFQKCMEELNNTPFKNGTIFDQRNFLMPTEDGSLEGDYPVEFWLCPMSSKFAKEFFSVFLPILEKHGWESSTEENYSGLHCHLDAHLFCQKTLRQLIDKVYDMSENEKMALYNRKPGFNNWEKGSCFETSRKLIKTNIKAPNSDEYYYLKTSVILPRYRRTLLNLEHLRYSTDSYYDTNYEDLKGTLELRGFNSDVLLNKNIGYEKVIDSIDNMVKESLCLTQN